MNEKERAIDHAETIEGWMFRPELATLYDWALEMDTVVEVGAWKGRSTYVLAQACKGEVYAVDTFAGSPDEPEHMERIRAAGGSTLREFQANTAGCPNVVAQALDSVQAAALLPDIDMVFIDGGHSYEQVLADLKAWAPKARKLICGHDGQHPPVARALREVLGQIEYGPGSLWFRWVEASLPAPLFSILHTSARPDKWRAVYDDWMAKAVHPEEVEYVLCVDPRWGFDTSPASFESVPGNIHVVLNNRRKCYVDGVNIAAAASTGVILIVNADDQFAAERWDIELGRAVEFSDIGKGGHGLFVVDVNTGTPDESERGIMPMPILSRARYEQQGYVFYPEYESMYADNEFCETARKDGVVIDARHLLFPHRHPMFIDGHWREMKPSDPDWDAAYREQNRREAFKVGLEILERRKLAGFPPTARQPRTLALCLSGERFEGPWVDAILSLYGRLRDLDFSIMRLRPNSKTNVYVTREQIRRALMASEVRPDLCLWIDDDNPLSVEHFNMLLEGLDAHPEADGVAGWCWIHNEKKQNFMVSAGNWAPDHLHWIPFPPSFEHEQGLRPFECGGLPVMLMRFSALEKAGDGAFLPVLDNRQEFGISGEDISFFLHAEKGGARFLVDPGVRVPHLKYVEVCPVFPSEGKAPVKVAGMIRARNEGRWIGRTVASLRDLCGEHIYVLEDGSTDDTVEVATLAGAVVISSPFAGLGLGEVRDKNWFLSAVKEMCSPDWCIMLDGDEELQIGGCEIIRREVEKNPPVDCLSLGVLNLWDSIDTRRVDGVYGRMGRQSLFRANSGLEFQSFYTGDQANGNHCGLHCSNAPGLGQARFANLNVFFYHYGPLHRADRIRKYLWISALDPNNEAEGFYEHMVQGDLPGILPEMKLKHGGPLKLEQLPARLVPKFDNGVPGPLDVAASAAGAGSDGASSPAYTGI